MIGFFPFSFVYVITAPSSKEYAGFGAGYAAEAGRAPPFDGWTSTNSDRTPLHAGFFQFKIQIWNVIL